MARRGPLAVAVAVAAAAGGCGGGEAVPVADAVAAPSVTVELPPIEVAAGSERISCYYTEVELGAGRAVRRWESDVAPGSHGLEVFATTEPIAPAGTLTDTCVLMGARPSQRARWLYGAALAHDASDLPRGVAMPLAARQPLIVRLHVVNSGDTPLLALASLRLETTAPGEPFVPAAVYSTFRSDLRLEPERVVTVTGSCPVPEGLTFFRLSSLSLRHSTLTEIMDDGGSLFRSVDSLHPGEVSWLDGGHVMNGRLGYVCRYLNLSGQVVTSGGVDGQDELCMMFGHVAPATVDHSCTDDVLDS